MNTLDWWRFANVLGNFEESYMSLTFLKKLDTDYRKEEEKRTNEILGVIK